MRPFEAPGGALILLKCVFELEERVEEVCLVIELGVLLLLNELKVDEAADEAEGWSRR